MDSLTSDPTAPLHAEIQQLRAQIAVLEAQAAAQVSGSTFGPAGPPLWFDAVSDAIFVTDTTWTIQHWNQAAAQLYGWAPAEAVGQPISALIAVARYLHGDSDAGAIQALHTTGSWRGTFVQRSREGREVVVEGATHTLTDANGTITGYIGINRDVTARVQAEQTLQRTLERLQILATTSHAFAEVVDDESTLLNRIARLTAESLAATCTIWLRSADQACIQPVAASDRDPTIQALLNTVIADIKILGDTPHPVAVVASSGHPLLIPVVNPEEIRAAVAPEQWAAFARVCPQSFIAVPLHAHGAVLGCLVFTRHDSEQPALSTDDLTLAQDLADRAALALINTRLYQQAQTAQQAAAESLARLDALIDSTPIGIGYLDHELRYQLVNPALAAINSCTPEDYLGRTPYELLPGIALRLGPMMRQVLATGEAVRDLELHSEAFPGAEEARDWLISAFPVHGSADSMRGVGVTITDITVSKRTAAALRETERKLGALFAILPVGISILDATGAIAYANPTAKQMMQLDQATLRTDASQRLRYLRPDGTPRPVAELAGARTFRERQPVVDVETGIVTESGAVVWVSASAVPVDFSDWQVVVVMTDITQRKQVEAAIRDSELRSRILFETMAQGVIYHDADGHMITANPAAEQILGLTLDQLQEWTIHAAHWQAIHADGTPFPAGDHPALVALHAGQEVRDVVMGVYHPGQDAYRWISIQAVPSFRPGDVSPTQVYTIFSDITEQRAAQRTLAAHAEALSQTNAELTRALQLKDEFLAMMSHELRTPLNAILSYSDSLAEEVYGPLTDRQRTALAQVTTSGQHLLALINDILDLAHLEGGRAVLETERIPIDDLCRRATQLVAVAAHQKGIFLSRMSAVGVDVVRADARRLTQILVNLLDNAIKFTPAGGKVGLEVTADVDREQIAFTVWDTGIGIAAADFARLFQPFTQVDGRLSRVYEGIGLGLSLVRQLVDLHGGSIQLESTPGQGSRFTVCLPWSAEENMLPLPKGVTADRLPVWVTPPRLVIADDQEVTLALYRDRLSQEGCEVTVARTGVEAVAQVRATRPDVAILDIQMPELDGLSAIRQIRADPVVGTTPIIALTALAMPGDREHCLKAGANVYLAKPVSIHTLLAAIAKACTDIAGGPT